MLDRSARNSDANLLLRRLPSPPRFSIAQQGRDFRKLLDGTNTHKPLLNVSSGTEHPAVPVGDLAEKKTTEAFATILHQQLIMALHKGYPLAITGGSPGIARLLPTSQLGKNPWIQQSASADGDSRAP